MLVEQLRRAHQEVVEVHGTRLEQTLLVLNIDLADLALEDLLGLLGELARPDVSFLAIEIVPCTDRGGNRLGSRLRSRMT